MQTAVGRAEALASAPTFSRLENRATRAQAWALHEVLAAQFIASHDKPPAELVLDIDASDVPLHGAQDFGAFHAHHDHHCYLPLYVFCGQAMLACVLRPSKIDRARHAAAVIKLWVARLRQACPASRFIVRADSGFCRRRLLQRCERPGVVCIIGLARNARLHAAVEVAEAALADAHQASGTKQRLIGESSYAAQSGPRDRRVISRLEYGQQGTNPRFVVTNLHGEPEALYDAGTASAARRKTASKRRNWTCSARGPVDRASWPTSSGCCWRRWPTRWCSGCVRWPCRAPISNGPVPPPSGCGC